MTDVEDARARFHHGDPGTPEHVWRRWSTGMPAVHFADLPTSGRVVVVAPHPDDESLGCGGTVASLSALGVEVDVVVCSDGDAAAHPEWLPAGSDLASLRRAEVEAAVARLSSRRSVGLHLLGLRDGRLTQERDRLDALLGPLVDGASLVIAPWPGDGHPDHAAVGAAVREVAGAVPRLEYPVWAWHWGQPDDLPGRCIRLPLSPSARRAKSAAVAAHRSQTTGTDPVVGPGVLAHFERDHETFVVDEATALVLDHVDRSSSRFFEDLHRSSPSGDPWDFGGSPGEIARHDHLVELLGERRFRQVIEVGCSTGHLTRRLAGRADRLLALDTSPTAVEVARRTCAGMGHVELRVAHVPDDLRDEDRDVDLVVLSEVGYYFDVAALRSLLDDLAAVCVPGAELLAGHWTGHSDDHVLGGVEVHRVISAHPAWELERSAPIDGHLVELWTAR